MVLKSFSNDKGNPRFTEKIDVLDLIINTHTEHEEKLDELVTKLEIVTEIVSKAGEGCDV